MNEKRDFREFLAYENKKKKTRREIFLEEMDQVITWKELLKEIMPYYPKAGNGLQPMPLKGCCGFILCSNGTGCPTRRWKMLFMIANH